MGDCNSAQNSNFNSINYEDEDDLALADKEDDDPEHLYDPTP